MLFLILKMTFVPNPACCGARYSSKKKVAASAVGEKEVVLRIEAL